MLDVQAYYGKLVRHEPLTEDEVNALLKELRAMRMASAYLADCHAASLESLPKSASKSMRDRLVSICHKAVSLLEADTGSIGWFGTGDSVRMLQTAKDRCQQVVADHSPERPSC